LPDQPSKIVFTKEVRVTYLGFWGGTYPWGDVTVDQHFDFASIIAHLHADELNNEDGMEGQIDPGSDRSLAIASAR
jgi:hypothetical protein